MPQKCAPGWRWVALVGACLAAPLGAVADDVGSYPLDAEPRSVAETGRVRCPRVDLVEYRGTRFAYSSPLRVHPAFRERLVGFEEVVAETALAHYGRAPRRAVHLGAYACRRMRRYPDYLSEHAFGNAIDVAGFDFAPLSRSQTLPFGAPSSLHRAFRVRLLDHWTATGGAGAAHAAFLHDLARRLVSREDLFRVLLGPAWPGHRNHFHLDCSNFRLVSIFDDPL